MLKINLKANICRLCFNTKCDFEGVEEIKEVLEIVLPKLNLEEEDKHLICSSCSVKLFAAFNFKTACTDTEDTIFQYVNSQEMRFVDLREIYLKEKGDIQSVDILGDQKICRLCFQLVGYGFVPLNEVDADIIDNYVPEVNFNATKDPMICKLCSDSLVTHATFLSSCLAAQEENRKVCGDPAEDRECCIKTEESKIEDDCDRKVCGYPAEDRECCIKTEEIKIEDDCNSVPLTRLENVEMIKNFDGTFSSENKPVEYKKHLLGKVRTYTCNRCDFKTVYKCSLKRHCLKHNSLTPTYILKSQDASSPCPLRDQARMFQCEKCPYRTHVRRIFMSHCWTHKVPSKMKVYECEKCHYRVTREDYFRRHQLRHEDSAEMIGNLKSGFSFENVPVKKRKVTYTCNRCDFKTVHKCSLQRHCLSHVSLTPTYNALKSQCKSESGGPLSPSSLRCQERMYQCEKCPYRTHLRDKFARHWSTHEVPSEVKVYQCEKCYYRGTRKDNFRLHQLRHEDSAVKYKKHPRRNVRTYTCNRCEFKTVHKYSLTRHFLKHKVSLTPTYISSKSQCKSESRDFSLLSPLRHEEGMYECKKCHYRTQLRQAFASHWRTHEVSSKANVYHCEKCHYRSIRKDHFVRHKLRHEDGRKVQIHMCDTCDFQTEYKKYLVKHRLRHKMNKRKDVKCYTTGDGELMYKCNVCKYETKNKRQLLVHRCHQVSPTKQLKFKCCTCAYQNDDKDKLTRHQEKHSSGMKTLKCDMCSYQTMWKSNFVRHQLRHKNINEVTTYDCDKCSYKSKYKSCLKNHVLLHNVLE